MEESSHKHATKSLPGHFTCIGTVDILQQKGLALWLNVVGLLLFVLAYFVSLWLVSLFRGEKNLPLFEIHDGQVIWIFVWGMLYIVGLIILHEAAHGIFFLIYTGSMPKFAYKLTYAYAAAPDWYIERNAYRVVAMAPIFLLSGGVFLVSLIAPVSWVIPLILFSSLNFSSAVGDLYVFLRLLRLPENALIKDEGDRMAFFAEAVTPSMLQDEKLD